MTTEIEKDKIKFTGDDGTKVKVTPNTKVGKIVTRALYEIKETGLPDMPTNEQLNKFGDEISKILGKLKGKESDVMTTKIIESVKNVVDDIQNTIKEKNIDESLQNITKKLKETVEEKVSEIESEVSDELRAIKASAKKLYPMIVSLGKDIIKNSEFRELLIDLLEIGQNTIKKVKEAPTGSTTDTNTSDYTTGMKTTGFGTSGMNTTDFGTSGMSTTSGYNTTDFGTTGMNTTGFGTSGMSTMSGTSGSNKSGYTSTKTTGLSTESSNEPIVEKLKEDIRDTSGSGLNLERTKEGIEEKIDNIKNIKLSEEEKEELINKACDAIASIKKNPEHTKFFENLFIIFDETLNIAYKISQKPEIKKAYEEACSFADFKKLFEKTCNRSMDDWENYLSEIVNIKDDEKYLVLRKNIEDLLIDKEQKYTTGESVREKVEELRSNIDELNDSYNQVFENFFRETQDIIVGITNDPLFSKIQEDLNEMVMTLFTDEHGRPSPTVVMDSLKRVKDIFFPIIKRKLKYIELPKIEIESDKYYFKLSKLGFKPSDLIPDKLQFETKSDITIDLDNMTRNGNFWLKFQISPFNFDIEGLKFRFKQKTGIKYYDAGIVDVFIRNAGITFEFLFKLRADKVDHFELENANVSLGNFDLKYIESEHEFWDNFMATFFMPFIRGKIERQINVYLKHVIETEICFRINDGLKSDFQNRKRVQKIFKEHKRVMSLEESLEKEKRKLEKMEGNLEKKREEQKQ